MYGSFVTSTQTIGVKPSSRDFIRLLVAAERDEECFSSVVAPQASHICMAKTGDLDFTRVIASPNHDGMTAMQVEEATAQLIQSV